MQAVEAIQHFRPSAPCKQSGLEKHHSLWANISTPKDRNSDLFLNPKGLLVTPPLHFGCTYYTHRSMQSLTLGSHRLCHVCTIPSACTSFQPVAALMAANGGEISKKAAFSLSASSSSLQVGCREAEHGFTYQTNSICNSKTLWSCSVLNPWHVMIKNKTQQSCIFQALHRGTVFSSSCENITLAVVKWEPLSQQSNSWSWEAQRLGNTSLQALGLRAAADQVLQKATCISCLCFLSPN